MRLIGICGAVAVIALLCSCMNHSNDYLRQSGQVSPIIVPPGVPAIKQAPYYPVPQSSSAASVKPVSLKPPTLV